MEARYLEAEEVKKKIAELRKNNQGSIKKELEHVHMNELRSLEEAYNRDINDHFDSWTQIFNNFNEKAKMAEELINDKHRDEMNSYIIKLEEKFNSSIKFPKEYLELKESEASLARLERYI
jgi:hypothetical protein